MRALVASGLAVLAVYTQVVHADPRTPQINPEHSRREDTQRLREQQRELDREAPLPPIVAAAPPSSAPPHAAVVEHDEKLASAGRVLLVVAGISAVATAALYAPQLGDARSDSSSADTAAVVTLATGLTGLLFLLVSHAPRVTPTVTPKVVGLAIASRF